MNFLLIAIFFRGSLCWSACVCLQLLMVKYKRRRLPAPPTHFNILVVTFLSLELQGLMVWGGDISVFDLCLTAECIFLSNSRPLGHRQISNAQNWGDLGSVERLTVRVLWPLQPRGEHWWITHRNKWGANRLSQSWTAAQADGGDQRLPPLMEMRRTCKITRVQLCTQTLWPPPPPNNIVCLTLCHRDRWVHSTRTCCSLLPWANTRGLTLTPIRLPHVSAEPFQ